MASCAWVRNSVMAVIRDCMEGKDGGHCGSWARGVWPMISSKGALEVVELGQALCTY